MKKNSPTPFRKTTDISQENPEGYLRQGYARIVVPEADGTFSAKLLEFPGCFAQGETADEAIRNLEEAAKSWIEAALDYSVQNNCSYTRHDLQLRDARNALLEVSCTVTPVDVARSLGYLIELVPANQQLRIAREERLLDQGAQTRELIRNLAHEIKNPLGGLRGAAQLLDRELARPDHREYTQVIIQEADRLQSLLDRLLTPNRLPQLVQFNVHEALERMRKLLLAEFPGDIVIECDYDVSLPPLTADREQIFQALLNIGRNAAQAVNGKGLIRLRSRVARRATLAKRVHRLALHPSRPDVVFIIQRWGKLLEDCALQVARVLVVYRNELRRSGRWRNRSSSWRITS